MKIVQSSVRRVRLLAATVGGLAVAASLGLAAPGATSAAPGPAEECEPSGGSTARVAAGYDGTDPNSVTAAEAAAFERKLSSASARLAAQGRLRLDGQPRGESTITVKTYVHVITAKDGTGAVSRRQIERQLAVINAGYAGRTAGSAAPSPFRFKLAGLDVTRNDTWYNWTLTEEGLEPPAMQEAKRKLRRGGYRDLNIYIAGLGSGLLGYATFPGEPLPLDGIVVLNESLPGGEAAPFNLGDTATHEIGHWLGLYHTFENGCESPGDHVWDTPYQDDGENIFYCGDWPGDGTTAVPDDTCPQPGRDPVHNFMSYGDDLCMDRFTHGQNLRQVIAWFAFRAGR